MTGCIHTAFHTLRSDRQQGRPGEAPCCRRQFTSTASWIGSAAHVPESTQFSPPTRDLKLPTEAGASTQILGLDLSHEILSKERSLLIAICATSNVWQILELKLLKTLTLFCNIYYWSTSQVGVWIWATKHLNLQTNTDTCGAAVGLPRAAPCLGRGKKRGQGEHI